MTPTLDDPWDADTYLYQLLNMPVPTEDYTQLQQDWDRFVTFAEVPGVIPRSSDSRYDAVSPAALQLPSPSSRSVTPSPLFAHLIVPKLVAPPMERHVTGSPEVVPPTVYPPPITSVPSPGLAPALRVDSSSPPATFIGHDVELLARSGVRQRTRRRVKEQPLHKTAEGREIIRLTSHAWYNAPSGFAVTQYPDTANWWRCNDVANYINWLDRGIRVHRSQLCRILAVENIEALNAVLTEQGYPAIVVKEAPQHFFPSLLGMGERQRDIPVFLRVGYTDRNHPQRLRNRKRPAPTT